MRRQGADEPADGIYEMSLEIGLHRIKPTDSFALVPVFFTPKMVANISSFSPGAGKPARVVDAWQRLERCLGVLPCITNKF